MTAGRAAGRGRVLPRSFYDRDALELAPELLNKLLTAAWEQYVEALETGSLVQLEDEASHWVDDILAQQLRPKLEAQLGDVANA